MDRIKFWLQNWWFITLISLFIITLVVCVTSYNLGGLVPASAPEKAYIANTTSLRSILHHGLFAPFDVIRWAGFKLHLTSLAEIRAVSIAFGFLVLFVFFRLLRIWHTKRISLLGVLLLASSTWFLQSSRMATPDILYFLLIPSLLLIGLWAERTKKPLIAMPIIGVWVAGLLFIPGSVWFIGGLAVWQCKKILQALRSIPWWGTGLASLAFAAIITPLIYSFVRSPVLLKSWFAVDHALPLIDSLKRIALVPINLFAYGPHQPERWLGHLPIIDIVSSVLCILGIYALYQKRDLLRSQLLPVLFGLSCVLIGLSHGQVSISLTLPIIYVVCISGITLLLQQWLTVFPRNPFARVVGVFLTIALVFSVCSYGFWRYFIAWPKSPETKRALTQVSKR